MRPTYFFTLFANRQVEITYICLINLDNLTVLQTVWVVTPHVVTIAMYLKYPFPLLEFLASCV